MSDPDPLSGVAAAALAWANAGGFACLSFPVPADPSLRGVVLHAQAAALDPTATPGFALSRGLRLVFGD